jgi:hypothetical protein
MPHARRLRPSVTVALAFVASLAGVARADTDKEVCVRAVERAQVARLDGKLRSAREGFVTCARPVCPDAIRRDCTRWVGEVDASLPSVVFEAVWADGHDATGMTVTLDGQPLLGADVGRAVPLDPGEHLFHFEVSGAAPVETRSVIREGEKNRILRVSFTPVTPPPPPQAASEPPPVAEAAPVSTASTVPPPPGLWHDIKPDDGGSTPVRAPIPVAAWVLGGVALVGFGSFAALGLTGTGQLDSLRSSCVHSCPESDVTSARNTILAGDILGFVGLAASGVAAFLVLTRPYVTPQVAQP